MKNRVYKCPNCDADLRFDPARNKIVCDYCDAVFNAEDYDEETGRWKNYGERFGKKIQYRREGVTMREVRSAMQKKPSDTENSGFWQNRYDDDPSLIDLTEFHCTQCGAKLYATDVTISTFCSYCGSHATLEARTVKGKRPDFIIPFSVDKAGCEAAYKKFLKKALFAPKYMKEDTEIENFRGIYMPYWVYELTNDDRFRVNGSTSTRRGDYVYTKHYTVTTDLKSSYKGVNFDASSAFADNLSGAIAPFDTKAGGDYNPAYLSGFYADAGDVNAGTYREDAIQAVREDLSDRVYDASRVYAENHVKRSEMEQKLPKPGVKNRKGLFPVWFLAIRNKKGDRLSYAVVNGQSGKTTAELPVDFKKYLLFSLLLAVPIFLLLFLLMTLTPTAMLVAGVALSLIALIIAHRQINRVYTKEQHLDDKGQLAVRPAPKKTTVKKKIRQSKNAAEILVIIGAVIVGIAGAAFMLYLLGEDLIFGELMFLFPVFITLLIALTKYLRNKVSDEARLERIDKAPLKMKAPVDLKLTIGILLSVVILIIRPVHDAWYYGAAVISMLLTASCFYDILKAYNLLTTRALPQFETRGGDPDAVS